MWQPSDLLIGLPVLLGGPEDTGNKSLHSMAAMLQRIGTLCASPPDLQSAMQLLHIDLLPPCRRQRPRHALALSSGMEPVVSPFEEPDASFHLSAFLRSSCNPNKDCQAGDCSTPDYDAALGLSKTASQQAARKQMLEKALAAQARPQDSLTLCSNLPCRTALTGDHMLQPAATRLT